MTFRVEAKRDVEVGSSNINRENEEERLKDNEMSYLSVALIQIGEVIGSGILTLPGAFAKLGWVLGIVLVIFFAVMAMFVGQLLTEAKAKYPKAESLAQLVRFSSNNKGLYLTVHIIIIIYTILSCAGYLVGATQAVQDLFFDSTWCIPLWGICIVALLVLPVQLRNFSSAKIISYINMFLIAFAVFASAIYMLINETDYHSYEETSKNITIETSVWPPKSSSWMDIFGAVSQIVFAFSASFFYLEMMREMKNPADFPKSIAISVPLQLVIYIFIASVGYSYGGQESHNMVTKYIDPESQPGLFRAANLSLTLHLCISYLLFGIPCARILNEEFCPSTLDKKGVKPTLTWAVISIGLLVLCYLLSNVIPLFDSICSISGSLFAPMLNMGIPALCYYGFASKIDIKFYYHFLLVILIIVTVAMTTVGTYANIKNFISAMNEDHSKIFECKMESYLDIRDA